MACEADEETVRCVPVTAEGKGNMEAADEGKGEGEVKDQEKNGKAKRRKPYNYALEKRAEAATDGWIEVKDGFLSPEAAIEHVTKAKLVGTFRAVRVASAEYVSELTTPDPVLTVKKLKK
jgi:hypothetical protein